MAQQFTGDQIAELKEVFNLFDKDGDGHVTTKELKDVVAAMDVNIANSEVPEMMDQVDDDRNDTLDFAEWLQYAAVQFLNIQHNDEVLKEAYHFFDKDKKGHIAVSDLRRMLSIMDEELRSRDIEEMLQEADLDRDGVINFDEFKAILLGR